MNPINGISEVRFCKYCQDYTVHLMKLVVVVNVLVHPI